MKQKLYFLVALFGCLLSSGQTTTLPYHISGQGPADLGYNLVLNNFTTCQTGGSLTVNGVSTGTLPVRYSVIVNNTTTIASNQYGLHTYDLTPYIPITSVKLLGCCASGWIVFDATATITSLSSSIPASGPTVSNVTYNQNAPASPLTATLTSTGASLKWYTSANGDNYSATAPTPNTSTVGTTSYWVAQADAGGCESARTQIVVTVAGPATHLNFDGVNDYIALSTTPTNIPSGNSNYTIEAWINPSQLGAKGIVGWGDYNVTNKVNAFRLTPTGLVNYWWNYDLTVNYAFTTGTWYHVAATYDGITRKIYVNGTVVGQDTPAAGVHNVTNTSNVTIGVTNNLTEYFNGSIDEVRIWNKALTASDFSNSMNCEAQAQTGLVAYYKFNQGVDASNNTTITTLTDATTNANHGTLTNFTKTGTTSNFLAGSPVTTGSVIPSAPTVTTPVVYNQGGTATALTATSGGIGLLWYTTATGGSGSTTAPTPSTATAGNTSYWVSSTNANGCESARALIVVTVNASATHLNFDGVDDRVVLGNILPASYTKEAWINISNSAFKNNILSSDNTSQHALWAPNDYSNKLSAGHNGIWNQVQDPTSLLVNTWYHVAVTYDAATTTMKLYKNGALVSSNTAVPAYTGTNDLQIGAYGGANNLFKGNIDEVRIWNKALSATDIVNTMNCELLTPASQPGLVAYYKFNQGFDTANNSTVTTATDSSANGNTRTLNGFALTGATSNWLSGSPVTTGNTCAALSNNEFTANTNFKVYPNPATNNVTIQFTDLNNAKLEVIDITGKLLMKQNLNSNSNTVNIEQLPSGLYLFKVSSSEGTATTKVVKQ